MENSDGENDSDLDIIDDVVEPEELFIDETAEDGGNENEESKENPEDNSKNKVETKVKTPRIIKNRRAVLNFNTLRGVTGLEALKKLFKNFKFKGNGHEKEDLVKIMGILQQWMCYQLCPSYDFETCMLLLEALGKKRNVQVLMKKFRLGMDEWDENKPNDENTVDNNVESGEKSNKNEFDLMLDEEMRNIRSDDELSPAEEVQTQNESQPVTQMDAEVTLTPEQLERIARNRKLAEERRLKRMSETSKVMEVNRESEKTGEQEISVENINLDENK